ncbi:MAG: sigma 54-interacting transcriptional regulator [Pirellulaceae bacterium]
MIRRIAIVVSDGKLKARLRALLSQDNVVLDEAEIASWRESLAQETVDLAVVSLDAVARGIDNPAPPPAPERFNVVVLVPSPEARRDATLTARGYAAVLPLSLPDELLQSAIGTVCSRPNRTEAGGGLSRPVEEPRLDDFASESAVMREFMALVRRLVATDASMLITGETGVGKERLARAIHRESPRRRGPFVALNCAALTETLLESELFGHESGAFTGAVRARRGRFELAHEGTILLDEIGEMPLHLQAKLLQVLQNREFYRVGGERPIRVDVRVMAATNRDLLADVESGQFRRDLFYRLGVVTVNVPPLRERREDIPTLVREAMESVRSQVPHAPLQVTPEAMSLLQAYDWPGNVRELIHMIEHVMLLAEGATITAADVPMSAGWKMPRAAAGSAQPVPPGEPVRWLTHTLQEVRQHAIDRVEQEYLWEQLRAAQGRIGETAKRAGVQPRWLFEKMRRFGLKKEDFRPGNPPPDPPERWIRWYL